MVCLIRVVGGVEVIHCEVPQYRILTGGGGEQPRHAPLAGSDYEGDLWQRAILVVDSSEDPLR